MNKEKTYRILFSLLKKRNTAMCNNIDESGGCYAKRNKPITEEQIINA